MDKEFDKELVRSKVEEISKLHNEVSCSIDNVVWQKREAIFRIGELLSECREVYGHGLWMAWLKSNEETLGFGYYTANNYINAYENKGKANFENVQNLTGLYMGKPQLEHKQPEKVQQKSEEPKPKVEEPEPLPARLQPPVKAVPKEQPELEVVEEEDQDDMEKELEHIVEIEFPKLDSEHRNTFIDWFEMFLVDLKESEKEAA